MTLKERMLHFQEIGLMWKAEASDWKREAKFWKEVARNHSNNEEYYRNLLIKIGEAIGEESYVSDDGSIQQDVLVAKVPELAIEYINMYKYLYGSNK